MTIDQDAYLRKAKSSIGAARSLLDDEYYEYAIARAYYAMFYLAQALLLGKGLTFSKHGSTLGAFGLHFIKWNKSFTATCLIAMIFVLLVITI